MSKTNSAPAGHNNVAGAQLSAFIQRIERLEVEKKALQDDIRQVYAEAEGQGFDKKVMRMLIAERRMDPAKLRETQELLDVYRHALGMLADTPLGAAALDKAAANA